MTESVGPSRSPELSSAAPDHWSHGWRILVLNLAPGLLMGAHFANLLFFLNPDLPFGPVPLGRVALVYASACGLSSALILTPVTWNRGTRGQRLLPWIITLVLAAVATLDWVYASLYSYYLPTGISLRMIKAAIWLTLTSLICFYTALLHTVHRRPYGRRSRYGFLILALASIYVMAERREAFEPRLRPPPLSSVVEVTQRPRLYVVGVGGASLDAVLPLARQGRLPFFARMLADGVYARPRSFAPVHGEALWTTLATGRPPFRHGIVSEELFPAPFVADDVYVSLLPTWLGARLWGSIYRPRPVDARFRRAVAVWEVLDRQRFSTGLVGWPVTDPVSESGVYRFSHRYFQGDFRSSMARPSELAERGVLFQVEPEDVDPVLLEGLGKQVPYPFLQALAEDLWRESLTLFLLDQRPQAEAVFLMLPGLARVSRGHFGGFAGVQFGGEQREPYLEAARLMTHYYRLLDRFLAEFWERTGRMGEHRLLVVVSAYGFEAPEGWRKLWAQLTGGAARGRSQRAPDGLLMMLGPGLQAGRFLEDADLVDVMPTLLYALGFPTARDLEGRVLTHAFAPEFLARNPLTFLPSYETLLPQELPAVFPTVVH